uniref:FAD-binding domain-containing protein n=2 Tax=cellular organisms TaxID=131567 RepID=A0AA39CLI8_9EURO|nr:hypothetical protein H2204_014821 [Knufia peltigerae]
MSERHDVLIVGGGLVGASLAIALDRLGRDVGLLEASPAGELPAVFDQRNLSFAAATINALTALRVMQKLSMAPGPIRRIHVSRAGDFGRVQLDAADYDRPWFGQVVVARDFGQALESRLQELPRLRRYRPMRFLGMGDVIDGYRQVRVADDSGERVLLARLVVGADGTSSGVRDALGIEVDRHDFQQTLFVARVRSQRAPDGTAWERFTDTGPTALLPRGDRHFGTVHGVARDQAEAVMALDDTAWLQRLQQAIGWRAGRLLDSGPRSAYPLIQVLARALVGERTVLLGNAAQTIHPLGAQGFNLGLRDALTLAELLEVEGDAGSDALLRSYVARREEDRRQTVAFSGGLARLTSNPAPLLRPLRSLGLVAAQRASVQSRMNRRARLDVVIVGGGVVGAACALALADVGLAVALVEGREPAPWQAAQPDLRVFAFAADNVQLLQRLGVWPTIAQARAWPYRRMQVWDAAGGDDLLFDADRFGRRELGFIVENGLLQDRLWAALPAAGVELHCPARVEALEQDEHGVRLRLDDGRRIEAALAVAADGAESTLRGLAGIDVERHDYLQRGVVAYVDSELPNQATAWQRFLPTGPLALLPVAERRSSIVWTLPDDEAARVLALDEDAFNRELTRAFAARLGELRLASPRAAFPLRRQLARHYVAGRVLALGDAAHVVHPLAGQGVNLGLRDVAALQHWLAPSAERRGQPRLSPQRVQRWARERRSDNQIAAYSFEAINRLFSNDEMHLTLARGRALGCVGKWPPLVQAFWKRAAGV